MNLFTPRQQRWTLFLLTAINFFNYVDRQVIFALFSNIKADFHLSDVQLGLLGTVFALVHSLASVPLGALADRYSRKLIIAIGVGFWSIMTFLSGATKSFVQLLIMRSLIGIGEASYAPAATSMLSDAFPSNQRGSVQGIFNAGMFVGGTLGAVVGGLIGYYYGSWRLAFTLVSIPGLILALSALTLPEQRTSRNQKTSFWSDLQELLKNPVFSWILVSGILTTFAAGAYIAWGVEFVHRFKGYNLRDAAIYLGTTMMFAGTFGILAGSYIADRWQKISETGRSNAVLLSLIASVPFIFLGFYQEGTGLLFFFLFFMGVFFLSFSLGPVTAIMHDVVPKHMRATSFALYLLIIHILGDTFAPAIVGAISDFQGLRFGLEFATGVLLIGALAFYPVIVLLKHKRVVIYYDDEAVIT